MEARGDGARALGSVDTAASLSPSDLGEMFGYGNEMVMSGARQL